MDLVELGIITSIMAGNYRWERRSDSEWSEIGQYLSSWRKTRGITLTDAADKLNVAKSTLIKFERGQYTSLRIYIDIWYRMLLAEKTEKFQEICRQKYWINMLLERDLNQDNAFKVFPRDIT